jgi:Tfp pilus assembly protein PilV
MLNKKSNRGQIMLEALVVIIFTSIIILAFIQICIIAVDDMIANESAFVAMRQAVVTKDNLRHKEARKKAKNYLSFFYPNTSFRAANFNTLRFALSDKKTVEKYFNRSNTYNENSQTFPTDNDSNYENKSISIWKGKKTSKDYSGKNITKETVKIYYFTRVLLASLVSNGNSSKNRRYQAARNRMVPSPDEKYYYKAFPKAKKF